MNESTNNTAIFLPGVNGETAKLPSEGTWEQIQEQSFAAAPAANGTAMYMAVPPPIVENPVPDSMLTVLLLAGIYACTILYKIRKKKLKAKN